MNSTWVLSLGVGEAHRTLYNYPLEKILSQWILWGGFDWFLFPPLGILRGLQMFDLNETSREALLDLASWHLPCENEKSQSRSGINSRVKNGVLGVHNMLLGDWSLRILGSIPEQHFLYSGINPRTSNSFLWDLIVKRLLYFGLG